MCRFPLCAMNKEIKPVVMEKHEFEYREETVLVAFFGTFGFI